MVMERVELAALGTQNGACERPASPPPMEEREPGSPAQAESASAEGQGEEDAAKTSVPLREPGRTQCDESRSLRPLRPETRRARRRQRRARQMPRPTPSPSSTANPFD